MATTTPNYGWPVPTSTDFVKDGATAIKALGDAIDTTVAGIPDTTLASGSISAQSALNLSSVLSDTYKFYTLIYLGTGSTTAINRIRFRENTTDVATNYVANNIAISTSGVASNWGSGSATTSIQVGRTSGTLNMFIKVDIYRPSATQGYGFYNANDVDGLQATLAGFFRSGMTTFNGISIYPDAGTMTGSYILTGRK